MDPHPVPTVCPCLDGGPEPGRGEGPGEVWQTGVTGCPITPGHPFEGLSGHPGGRFWGSDGPTLNPEHQGADDAPMRGNEVARTVGLVALTVSQVGAAVGTLHQAEHLIWRRAGSWIRSHTGPRSLFTEWRPRSPHCRPDPSHASHGTRLRPRVKRAPSRSASPPVGAACRKRHRPKHR